MERLPIVNTDGTVIGCASRAECHSGSMLLHPVVHLHVFDTSGCLLLQKRAKTKDIQPGKWDTAVGGHVDYGESIDMALLREAREELGIDCSNATLIKMYEFRSDVEHELVHVHVLTVDDRTQLHYALDEIDEVRFWSVEELCGAMGMNMLTPNFEQEFLSIVKPYHDEHIR
ncbi:MAG: NUDIX domain-containing protein [Muribaculaceae bacterium]|nr:NUDIX domain-containing protein [Muribaculaceae bacterium]